MLSPAEQPFGVVPASLVLPIAGFAFSAQQIELRTSGEAADAESLITRIARDSFGRIRLEWRTHPDKHGQTHHIVELMNPVDGSVVFLWPENETAAYLQRPQSGPGPFRIGPPAVGRIWPADQARISTEPLGARVVEGIEVEGVRITQALHDTDESISTQEKWSSERYGLTVLIETSEPNWKHAAQLQNVTRQPPAPELFSVPIGYTSRDW
jgi:hypothetical protein